MIPKSAKRPGRARRMRAVAKASCASLVALALGVVSLGTAQDAAPANADTPDSHSVAEGDTLWSLSGRYYKSPYDWPRLWSYNPEITNPHWIYPGHVLRLREGAKGGYTTVPPGASEEVAEGGEEQAEGPRIAFRAGFGRGFGKSGGGNMPLGTVTLGEQVYFDKKALDTAGKIVGSFEDHMMLFPSDEVYIAFDKKHSPEIGKEMSVFVRLHRAELSPKAAKVNVYTTNNGEVVRVAGAVKVKAWDEDKGMARAVITETTEPIERGFLVTDVPRRLAQVAPKTNAKTVKSAILAATRGLGTLGQNQLVFIGVGSDEGVEIGNRFSVMRQGDTWRRNLTLTEQESGASRPMPHPPRDKDYPLEIVGEARVIYTRPDSCTAILTSTTMEIVPGDKVEMREGY